MADMHVGFSGSAQSLTDFQREKIKQWLIDLGMRAQGDVVLHHGGAVVGDEYAHNTAKALGYKIELHPPLDKKLQFNYDPTDFVAVHPEYSYFGRNHRIVLACGILIAAPTKPFGKGGTWYTVQRMAELKKPHVVIRKDSVRTYYGA